MWNYIKRKIRSGGHGVHSPFAYELIREVLRSKYYYNAFFDIERLLGDNNISPKKCGEFNRLSFRLVYRFKSKKILEINSGDGINTLFITASDKSIRCYCLEDDEESLLVASNLYRQWNREISFISESGIDGDYDAVFFDASKFDIHLDRLISISSEDAFWVVSSINVGVGKQFWKNIVNHKKVSYSFDMGEYGVVFLKSSYYKLNLKI